MLLGLKKDEVKIVPYQPQWKITFEIIKKQLMSEITLEPNQIEHIGSTSIIGMDASQCWIY